MPFLLECTLEGNTIRYHYQEERQAIEKAGHLKQIGATGCVVKECASSPDRYILN